MAKQVRSSRTRADSGGFETRTPSVNTQVIRRNSAGPRVDFASGSDVLGPGAYANMPNLGEAFNRLAAQVANAGNSFRQGAEYGIRRRIEAENKAEKAQAISDFYAGKSMDENLVDDADYYDTYRTLLAHRTGNEAAKDFQEWVLQEWLPENPMGDLGDARNDYIEQNIAGQSDDPVLEAQVLGTFVENTDQMVLDQQKNAVALQIEMGKDNILADINADAENGKLTPDRITFYTDAYRKIDPANPDKAAAFIASSIQTAITNNPEQTNAILATLRVKGTGLNGESFAKSFPDAYVQIEQKAVEDFHNINTMEEDEAAQGLLERSDKLPSMTPDEINQFIADIEKTNQQYGIANVANRVRSAAMTELQKRQVTMTDNATFKAIVDGVEQPNGELQRNVEKANKFLKETYGVTNILDAPEVMSTVITRFGGVVPTDWKTQISSAFMSFENPEAQIKAINLMDAVSAIRTDGFAGDLLTDEARRFYRQVQDHMSLTNNNVEEAVAYLNSRRRDIENNTSWVDVGVADTPTEAKKMVEEEIVNQYENLMGVSGFLGLGLFGAESLSMTTGYKQNVMDYALKSAVERYNQGVPWQDSVKEAVQDTLFRTEIIPQNGQYMLYQSTDLPPYYDDEEGDIQIRVKMGFKVINPNTGKNVNTVEVYEEGLKKLSEFYPTFLDEGSVEDVSLNYNPKFRKQGVYEVRQGGAPIMFRPGATFEVPEIPSPSGDGVSPTWATEPGADPAPENPNFPSGQDGFKTTEVTINTLEELQAAFPDLPPGFGFGSTTDYEGKEVWMMVYRPNFGDETGMSLRERELQLDQERNITTPIGPQTTGGRF